MPLIAPEIAEVAQLVADPGRAKMLSSLMDGRAKTAGELAIIAGITPQTASSHLAKLVQRALLSVENRGPRRFYRLAGPPVARMLTSIMIVAAAGPKRFRPRSTVDDDAYRANICYDHLAGRLGVAVADGLKRHGYLTLDEDGGELTASGCKFFRSLGLDLQRTTDARMFCRPCPDWSEQRPHLAGRIGAEIAELALRRDWIRRKPDVCSVEITSSGSISFRTLFGADI